MKQFTEDDTYDALRRIPRARLEEELLLPCDALQHFEDTRFRERVIYEKEIRRYALMSKLRFIFGEPELITINTAQPRALLSMRYEPDFKGTGWTVEDYCELVYKECEERYRRAIGIKKKKVWVFVACCAASGGLSALITPFLGHVVFKTAMPILLGFGGGQVFINIARNMDRNSESL
jgi:hypothetical protein